MEIYAQTLDSCPIHVVTFTLISILVTDFIQKKRGQALLYIKVKVTTWIGHQTLFPFSFEESCCQILHKFQTIWCPWVHCYKSYWWLILDMYPVFFSVFPIFKLNTKYWILIVSLQKFSFRIHGGFQLLDLILTELKSHMTC